MENIFRTIKAKIFIILGIVTLSWIIFGILSISSHNTLKSLQQLKDLLGAYTHSLQDLSVSTEELKSPKTIQEITLAKNNTVSVLTPYAEAKNHLAAITSDLSDNPYFINDSERTEMLMNSTKILESIDEEYKQTIKLLKERGFGETGAVNDWNNAAGRLQDVSFKLNQNAVSGSVNELLTLKQNYLESPDPSIINAITLKSEQLKNFTESDTTFLGTAPTLANELRNANEQFVAAANPVLEKDIQIGFTAESGMVSSMNKEIQFLEDEFYDLQMKVEAAYRKIARRSTFFLFIFWIFFTILSVGLLLWIGSHLEKSLKKIKQFVSQIGHGMLPEKLKFKQQDEFQDLATHLNDFLKHLQSKIDFAGYLAEGKTNAEYEPISDNDALGNALLSLQENLKKTKEEEEKNQIEGEKRRWTNEGLARFAEILRQNNDNMEDLASNLISNLVKYVNATQGGLFLVNDDDKDNLTIELKAAVAYDRKKYIKKAFEMGEGLVGTVAIEKKSILLSEIPEEYIEITSGLGDSEPKCILIVPLSLENEVLGVVELASFTLFSPHEVEFIERLGESIASTLTTVKVNEKTSKLLSQSQRQAAEMAEQEEEMRQSMEELQATQEEASRRESEISSILNAINTTSLVVEYDTGGHIININERFLKLLEVSKAEVMGTHHSDFTSKIRTENSYIEFWNTLMKGETINNTEVIRLLNGKKLWLNQSYTPILNEEGKPNRFLNIAIDITENKTKEQSLEKKSRDMQKKTNEINTLNSAINQSVIKCEYSSEGTIVEANTNYAEMMGYPLEEIIGQKVKRFLSEEERTVLDSFWPNLVNNKPHKINLKRVKPGGEEVWLISTFTPVVDENDKVYKIFYLAQDITEQRMKYDLLVVANKEIDRLKSIMEEEGFDINTDNE